MRSILHARPGEKPRRVEGGEELARLFREGQGCLWVDFEQPDGDDRRALSAFFSFHRLGRGEFGVISKEEAILFRDVYDRAYRVFDLLESLRNVLANAPETYLSVASNRANEVARVLTVFSIILMTAGLMAGIYGMNFEVIPLAKSGAGFYVVVGLMAVVAVTLLTAFRRRRWI